MDEKIARYAEFPEALKDENGNSITKEMQYRTFHPPDCSKQYFKNVNP